MGSSSRAKTSLRPYHRKRDFSRTPEPEGKADARPSGNRYIIQKHAARALHYDFRLELDGVLKSWAVPKGPSLDPADKRLAMETEDHPLEYGGFEGTIPKGQYGGGTVLLWDRGTWSAEADAREGYRKGAFKFQLHGEKLQGGWALFRIKGREKRADARTWLLVKEKDRFARPGEGARLLEERAESVSTGRNMDAIAAEKGGDVWESNRPRDREHASRSHRVPATDARAKPGAGARLSPNRSGASRRAAVRAADIEGARKGRAPRFGSPQQPTLVTTPPGGDSWLHEMKFDGYRVLARVSGKKVRLASRNGSDWTKKLPGVAQEVASLGADVVLDGEVAVLRADGTTSFQDLQAALGEGGEGIVYFVFDLLYWDGYDLTRAPLEARKEALAALIEGAKHKDASILRYSQHVPGHGEEFFRNACRMSLEGVVSKRRDAPYEPGRSRAWLKVKCVKEQEVVVGGYTEPSGSRTGIGALLVGVHDGGRLRYAGKVGTGYTRKVLEDLRRRLGALERAKSPFEGRIPGAAKAHWVAPRLVAQVRFSEWTRDGRLRHPSFEGLRLDKKPAEVVREMPRATKAVVGDAESASAAPPRKLRRPIARARAARSPQDEARVGGVRITHPSRVIDPASGLTKVDIARYYEAVADRILPHLTGRPLTLVRCPEGIGKECFYSKHAGRVSVPPALRRVKIREKTKTDEYLIADTAEALLGLVQMGVLEVHTWNARYEKLETPDRIVLDLDPGPGVSWTRVIEAALELREALSGRGLTSFVKTTGGKGLHIVAPLTPNTRAGWDACFTFARDLAQDAARKSPRAYVTVVSKAQREGRILIDYLRNNRGATSVAAYSARARANVPVSAPIGWEELDSRLRPDAYTVKNLFRRLASMRRDPWAGYDEVRQSLPVEGKRSAR